MNDLTQKQEQAQPETELELTQRFFQLQTQEVVLRREELTLKQQQLNNTYEYSKKVLETNLEDRHRERDYKQTLSKQRLIFAGLVVVILAVFITIALFLNKDQIALELIKTLATLLIGGLGGYSLGRLKGKKDEADD